MTMTAAPVDNLVRAVFGDESAELRAEAAPGDGGTLLGHFAVFNKWTEIDSMWEGHFMERIAPGAFADTIAARGDRVKVLYDHGQDPSMGNKPLGAIRTLQEDAKGVYYEVDLLRDDSGQLVSYLRDWLVPAARAKLLGSSFRFRVTDDEYVEPKSSTKANPAKLRERTITGVDLFEFGPVTFPQYEAATAQVRCGTDRWVDSLTRDHAFLARMIERVGVNTVEQIIAGLPPQPVPAIRDAVDDPTADGETTTGGPAVDDPDDRWSPQSRRAALAARGLI